MAGATLAERERSARFRVAGGADLVARLAANVRDGPTDRDMMRLASAHLALDDSYRQWRVLRAELRRQEHRAARS